MASPSIPRYGVGSLGELVPSLLAALGEPGFTDALGLGQARSACLLLVDGLGARLLAEHADVAPVLTGHRAGELTAGYPATTATSITSIGTGLPPGRHGVVGLRWAPDHGSGLLNALSWQISDPDAPLLPAAPAPEHPALDVAVPEQVQPEATAFERAADVTITVVAPPFQKSSGLTRAALRGSAFSGAPSWGVLIDRVAAALREPGLVYAYVSDLDTTGHVLGPGTPGWRAQLGLVDQLVSALAEQLPTDSLLVVTGDHGMVTCGRDTWIDLDTTPELLAGVRALGGEPRARYVYAEPGAADDVLAAWRERLAGRAWVASAAEAEAAGWFGPVVADYVRPRLGDVVAAATDQFALVRSRAEPHITLMRGQHGSFTPAEQLVPLLSLRG
ncbi:MAG: alkaline phosphatase family protein [Frankia sp.]|nr:alkaline phosphatase family protein [Frankia sp.]